MLQKELKSHGIKPFFRLFLYKKENMFFFEKAIYFFFYLW